jgi:hypothetical protein
VEEEGWGGHGPKTDRSAKEEVNFVMTDFNISANLNNSFLNCFKAKP